MFSTANRLCDPGSQFNVLLLAEDKGPINARGGFQVLPHYSIDSHPPIEVLVVVGGIHTAQVQNKTVIQWIAKVAAKAELTTSVCTGAFLLAQAGLLQGRDVTTHWEDADDLQRDYPKLNVRNGPRWVDSGNIITSGGISAGIDMSLYLLARLRGKTLAEKTARQMAFDWQHQSD